MSPSIHTERGTARRPYFATYLREEQRHRWYQEETKGPHYIHTSLVSRELLPSPAHRGNDGASTVHNEEAALVMHVMPIPHSTVGLRLRASDKVSTAKYIELSILFSSTGLLFQLTPPVTFGWRSKSCEQTLLYAALLFRT